MRTPSFGYYHGGSFLVAAPLFEEAAKKEPANPTYHYHLGLTYQKLKEPTRARAELQKAISIAPKSPIADLARQADDYVKLAGHSRRAIIEAPSK
jgi:Tfp pilus assembly protein PilF